MPGVLLSVHLVNVQKALPVSPLALLGASATLLSTCTLVPHLVHALRSGRPGGSTMGWALGFLSSLAWCVYGLSVGDLVVAAPGVITLPIGATLVVWCHLTTRRGRPAPVAAVPVPRQPVEAVTRALTETLELPRIA